MKKLLLYVILALLTFPLCSCVKITAPEPAEPRSMPELESIIEPVSGDDASMAVESEAQAASVSEAESKIEPIAAPVASSSPVPDISVNAASAPDVSTAAETAEPELFGAIAPDKQLDCEAVEKELLRLINSLRDEVGAHSLGVEDGMQFAARIRAAEAIESFSHTRPEETPYNTAFDEAGFSYAGKWHGENLSSLSCPRLTLSEEEIALEMFNGLKNSPGHYRNMTETKFVQAGIGVAVTYTDDYVKITSAQMFASL